jgi:nitrite reductase (NADH) small subunit
MKGWIDVGPLADIPKKGARVFTASGIPIAVFRTATDGIFALEDRCPHKNGPLSQGIVHGERVTCPLHDWVLELVSGEALAPDEGCVRTFEVAVGEDGHIRLRLDTPAMALAGE